MSIANGCSGRNGASHCLCAKCWGTLRHTNPFNSLSHSMWVSECALAHVPGCNVRAGANDFAFCGLRTLCLRWVEGCNRSPAVPTPSGDLLGFGHCTAKPCSPARPEIPAFGFWPQIRLSLPVRAQCTSMYISLAFLSVAPILGLNAAPSTGISLYPKVGPTGWCGCRGIMIR